jgi:hypothetical protein
LQINKNGSEAYVGSPMVMYDANAATAIRLNVSTPVLVVTPGDFFQAFLTIQTDTSVTVEADMSWFAIEKVS